jgi:hypothetical protein
VEGPTGTEGRRGDTCDGPWGCAVVGVDGVGDEGLRGDGGGLGMD